ncbi:MAG: serine--tRNA ligase [Candidatus Marsarchaeota archaeon]|nr:serine--tRNA ligase [Candidatus Marsarchaeota archaeon]
MLTTKYVRDHIDEIKKSLEKRKSAYPIDELLNLDMDIRKLKTELQELQAKRNKESMEISEKKKKNEDIGEKINTLKVVKEKIEAIESELPSYQDRVNFLLWNMPNILHESVPYGKNDEENIEMKKWGEQKNKKNGKSHDEILKELDMVDIERAAKVSGARFYYLKNDLVLLEQSLLRFALDFFIKKGFTPISPPFMLRKEYYRGVTALGDFEDALYKISDPKEISGNNEYEKLEDELFLISTSEHPMAAMHSNEVFPASKLPLKYVGISPCFRREAGSHGKDTKGIFRVHQFNKVEQFIFSKQEDSWSYFNELLSNSEEIVKDLGIPYRIVNICTGDIGIVAAKKIDIEAYMPLQKKYREITSCSNCTDWQSLRLDIKYDENNERKYVHTLNSTGIAAQRLIVAIVENYVNDDGTITVPKLLVPYLGKEILGK